MTESVDAYRELLGIDTLQNLQCLHERCRRQGPRWEGGDSRPSHHGDEYDPREGAKCLHALRKAFTSDMELRAYYLEITKEHKEKKELGVKGNVPTTFKAAQNYLATFWLRSADSSLVGKMTPS